jgi:hypothetical protein
MPPAHWEFHAAAWHGCGRGHRLIVLGEAVPFVLDGRTADLPIILSVLIPGECQSSKCLAICSHNGIAFAFKAEVYSTPLVSLLGFGAPAAG